MPIIYITGQNFGADINQLKVKFKGAISDELYTLTLSSILSDPAHGLLVALPTDREFIGINSSLQVERTIPPANANPPLVLTSKSVSAKTEVPWDNLALVPQSFARSVSVFRTDNYANISISITIIAIY